VGYPHPADFYSLIKDVLFEKSPKIFDFGLQTSGVASSMAESQCLENLHRAFDQILAKMFQREQGFIKLWQDTVIGEYKAIEDIPNITEFKTCFERLERKFRKSNKKVLVIHDELLQQMRVNELDNAMSSLVQLSNVPQDELVKFYGSDISACTRLGDLYAELAKMYVSQGNGEEGLRQYYEALQPYYKKRIPEALRQTLSLGDRAEFKYWEGERFVQEWVSVIAMAEDRLVGYSHKQQALKVFFSNQVQHCVWLSPAQSSANAQATKKRRRDEAEVGDEVEEIWRHFDVAQRILARIRSVAAIAHEFPVPAAFLEDPTYTAALFALLNDRLRTYAGLCESAAWLVEEEDNLAIVDGTLLHFPDAYQRLLKLREALETLPEIRGALRDFSSQGGLWDGWTDTVANDAATLPELSFLNRRIRSLQRVVRRVIFADNMEHGPGDWAAQPPWALTTETAHSPTQCWTDSPTGHYSNNANVSLFSPRLNFSGRRTVTLTFWQRYDLESGYDFGRVWITTDNGATFTQVAAFTGTQATWTQATLNLNAFAGQPSVKVVFQLVSDASVTREGWYIDDVVVSGDIVGPQLDLLAFS